MCSVLKIRRTLTDQFHSDSFTHEYDHDDKGGQVRGSGHPHADKTIMFSRHHVPQEPCRKLRFYSHTFKIKKRIVSARQQSSLVLYIYWGSYYELIYVHVPALAQCLSTFVLLILSECLHAGHQDVVVSQKLIQQKTTESVSETLVLHGICTETSVSLRQCMTLPVLRCVSQVWIPGKYQVCYPTWPPWQGYWVFVLCSETDVGNRTPENIPRCIPPEARLKHNNNKSQVRRRNLGDTGEDEGQDDEDDEDQEASFTADPFLMLHFSWFNIWCDVTE